MSTEDDVMGGSVCVCVYVCVAEVYVELSCVFVRSVSYLGQRKIKLGDSTKVSKDRTPPLKWKGG